MSECECVSKRRCVDCVACLRDRSALLKKYISEHESKAVHESDVTCLEFVFDGAVLLTGSKDATLKAWDWCASCARRRRLRALSSTLSSLAQFDERL